MILTRRKQGGLAFHCGFAAASLQDSFFARDLISAESYERQQAGLQPAQCPCLHIICKLARLNAFQALGTKCVLLSLPPKR